MKATLRQWLEKFDALSTRERVLVAAALVCGTVFVLWSNLIEPARLQTNAARQSVAGQRQQMQTLQAQIAALQMPGRTPEALAQAELDALKQQIGETGERLKALESALVPPERMIALLENMIGGSRGLRILGVRTLPVAAVLDKKEAGKEADKAAAADAGGLFRHGVEIRLEGDYADLTEYLARLERLPQKLLWSQVSLSAERHPKLVLTLIVFTLSLDRTWMVF